MRDGRALGGGAERKRQSSPAWLNPVGTIGPIMRAHVLVPVKRLDAAKSRLAARLSPDERAGLMRELLEIVLAAVSGADVGPVTVVSAERLELNGLPRWDDRGLEWNEALAAAMHEVVEEPVATIVSADLPLLTIDDVRERVEATPARGIAIARAQDGGTNAVSMRPPAVLRTRFGERGSARLHARTAEALGLSHRMVDLPGLAFDVDTPADLERLRLTSSSRCLAP
jgi:2-phospho-L-lactate/phosphoenolpyruvate guanylyltransferase